MADYYPLIARAIAGLDPNAPGESRRALYERARTALISQLRSVQPPLSEAEITRERLALEEAVRKVEAEAIRRSAGSEQAEAGPREAANSAPEQPPAPPRPAPVVKRDGPRPGDALRDTARNVRAAAPPLPAGSPRPFGRPDAPDQRPPRNLRGPEPSPLRTEGTNGLPASMRDVRPDDVQGGDEAPWTPRTAGAPPQRPIEPPASPSRRGGPPVEHADEPDTAPYSYDESVEEAERYRPTDRQRVRIAPRGADEPRVGRRFPVVGAVVVGLVIVAIGAAVWGGPKAYSFLRSYFTSPAADVADQAKETPGTRPKITDRVGQPGSTQVAPVAQRVVLYDEDPSVPQGKQYVGTVVWRTEPVKVAPGQPPDIGVRADIEVPERKFKMSLSIRRNTDASLPASHTAELTFTLPPDFGTTVANVPGILMKSNEQARGTPLAGLAVKVTDGFFLVGLSNVEADKSRNLQLLKERSWFDIPLVYANQRRSIVAIEKGAPGERAFNEAFTAWGQ